MNTEPFSSPAPMGHRDTKSSLVVIVSGLGTTGLALLGVYLLNQRSDDFNIMGWYANYILPVGALIVGVVASSGYGIASWFSGVKITKSLLWTVLGLQTLAYFAAQYIEFKSMQLIYEDGTLVGFWTYFDFAARSFAWQQNDGSPGEPLGLWGYALRGLELAGFLGGSLIVPAVMSKRPYCPDCQRYMRTKQLVRVAASVPARKVKKSDTAGQAAYDAEQQQAFEAGLQKIEAVQQLASAQKPSEFQTVLVELKPDERAAGKLPRQFILKLVECKRCRSGWLQADVFLQGSQIQRKEFNRAEVNPEFVRMVWP